MLAPVRRVLSLALLLVGCAEDPTPPAAAAAPEEVAAREAVAPSEQAPRDETPPAFAGDAELLASAPGRLDPEARTVVLRWPVGATDDVGVVAYVVRIDGEEATRLDAPAERAELEGVAFTTGHTFTVVAVDEAGNESAPLTTNDALAPWFPEGTEVGIDTTDGSCTISWPAAEDDVGVTGYSIQRGDDELESLGPDTLRYRLPRGVETGVTIVALDAAAHKTELLARGLEGAVATAQIERMLLGGLSGPNGTLADVLAGGAVTGDTADVMARADGVGVAPAPQGWSGGGGRTGGLGGLARASAVPPTATVTSPRGQVTVSGPEGGSGTGDPRAPLVTRQVRARLSAIRACYDRELTTTPTIAGRVVVRFTVTPSGALTDASATENTSGSDPLAQCALATIRRLRLPHWPDDATADYAYAFTFTPAP